MRNIALTLMYVGTAYHGWQVQKNAQSVAGTLERAVSSVVCHPVRLTGCGRTDAGVHARVYVASFRTQSAIPAERLPLAVNSRLPADIVVTAARDMEEGFSAIGSCLRKEYTYEIYNSRIRNAFLVDRAWFYPAPLDEGVMAAAAAQFVGRRDFAAMQSAGAAVRTTVRTVYYCEVKREGVRVTLRVAADGFLYNMVRAITGTVVYAAEGKIAPADIPDILAGRSRTQGGPTAPPGGLYLTRLWYPAPLGEVY